MKRQLSIRIIALIFLLSSPLLGFSQKESGENREERIQAMRIGFYTDLLKLTPKEAIQFWPLFNAYTKDRTQLESKRRKIYQFSKKNDAIEEEIAKEKLKELEEVQSAIHQLHRTYIMKFSKILNSSQLLKLSAAEFEFNRFLLHKFRKRRGKRRKSFD